MEESSGRRGVPLSVRIARKTHAKIVADAEAAGRSVTAEVERLLDQAHVVEQLSGSPELRTIVHNIAATLTAAGSMNAQLLRRSRPELLVDQAWVKDPFCYRAASLSAARVLWRHDPGASDDPEATLAAQEKWLDHLHHQFRQDAAAAIARQKNPHGAVASDEMRALGFEVIEPPED